MSPQTLARDGIAARIPHAGGMCLLDRLLSWDADRIHCSATSHLDAHNPLRSAGGLLAPCAIEYAAQAMALHGGLLATEGDPPSAGFLASARSVRFDVERLDELAGALQVHARRLSGDERQVLYEFELGDEAGRPVASGRAVVVLNTPIPAAAPAGPGTATTSAAPTPAGRPVTPQAPTSTDSTSFNQKPTP